MLQQFGFVCVFQQGGNARCVEGALQRRDVELRPPVGFASCSIEAGYAAADGTVDEHVVV